MSGTCRYQLKTVVRAEFDKLRPKGIRMLKNVTRAIAHFVYKAVLDLIERAEQYCLKRGEEDSRSLRLEDVIQSYRDLGYAYVLTDEDNGNLFCQFNCPNNIVHMYGFTTRQLVELLLRDKLPRLFHELSTMYFTSIYIELLSRELLEESIALLAPLSMRISENDAKNAVKRRENEDIRD